MKTRFSTRAILSLLLWLFFSAGCTTMMEDRLPPDPPGSGLVVRVKPIVAIMDFENRASYSGKWKLGSGMADVLVTELLDTKRFTVLERKHIDDLLKELMRQGQSLFREEGRVSRGRLKNAEYMIRGVITDFTVTSDTSGWFGASKSQVRGGGSRARVAMNIMVSDVETGEIVSSVRAEKSVGLGWFGGTINYKKLSFGGDAFFRTPLGKATGKAIAKCVKQMLRDLPLEYWQPRIAEAGPDMVIINGGRNVKMKVGNLFLVREEGREITDPVTGNRIEIIPGRAIGKVRVEEVKALSSHAVILEGEARRGLYLEWVE